MGEAAMMVVWLGMNSIPLSDDGKRDLLHEDTSSYQEEQKEMPSSMQEPPFRFGLPSSFR